MTHPNDYVADEGDPTLRRMTGELLDGAETEAADAVPAGALREPVRADRLTGFRRPPGDSARRPNPSGGAGQHGGGAGQHGGRAGQPPDRPPRRQ